MLRDGHQFTHTPLLASRWLTLRHHVAADRWRHGRLATGVSGSDEPGRQPAERRYGKYDSDQQNEPGDNGVQDEARLVR